ncbi:MAG: SRPBCC family protein [Solirubrobacteraceae bacterium]
MPRASHTRVLGIPAGELWETVRDPYHLARWWPRVERVEGVDGEFFTEVLRSSSGKLVRADFEIVELDEREMRVRWAQQIAGTPFERVLASSETELKVSPRMGMNESASTEVTITLSQTPHGWFAGTSASPQRGSPMLNGLFARLGAPLVRRAAAKTVKEALDGLQQLCD